jgi:hypothetical protein
MKSFLLVIAGLVVGAVGMFVVASGVFTGIGAGVGIVTGLKAGACLTVEAAKDRGFITGEQVGEVLQAAGRQLSSTNIEEQSGFELSDAECMRVVQELKDAVGK